MPPADFDSLRGNVGALFVALLPRFAVGTGRWFLWPFLGWCVTENVYSLTAYPAGGHFLVRQKVTPRRVGGQGMYIFSYALAQERPQKTTNLATQ